MPIPPITELASIPDRIAVAVATYNRAGTSTAGYNATYQNFINDRANGIAACGGLAAWLATPGSATDTHNLLDRFGMNRQGSRLVPPYRLHEVLSGLAPTAVDWIAGFRIPLLAAPCALVCPDRATNLATDLAGLYTSLAIRGAVTASGGFVAASKTLHCLFPDLAPMIDNRHTGLSYYHIDRRTYMPPLGLTDWAAWSGRPMARVPNPSPKGGGRTSWDFDRFLAALGIGQSIYEGWLAIHPGLGLQDFMALDPAVGTTGVPRIIDKTLW